MTTVTYDETIRALYIQFSDAAVAETIELSKDVYLDVDVDARPVGVEILNAEPAFAKQLAGNPGAVDLADVLRPHAA